MRLSSPLFFASLLALTAQGAVAGPFGDAEAALRGVYGQYRVALFATNSGNAEKSAQAIAAFDAGWAGLATTLPAAPQYQDDPALTATLAAVSSHVSHATEAAKSGDLPQAHEALEGIRGEIGALQSRNGI